MPKTRKISRAPRTTANNNADDNAVSTTNPKIEEAEDTVSGVKRSSSLSEEASMSTTRSLPLLICSIGNPGSTYANTLHSAGHTVIQRLADKLNFPPFKKDRAHGNGLLTHGFAPSGAPWTLWQSTSYMNVSGAGVAAAYRAWSRDLPDGEGRLVVVHDELEKPLGSVNLKTTQGASAKGHNGLKSIKSSIGSVPFDRIGVGIGRPVSRDSDEVARYVLRKMTPNERETIGNAVDDIVSKLEQVH
ncbi:hypothetical protein AMS68_004504 [Peltaster fructicola]|uniref:peptidyl-tRNA hydrolase n=1 Tax=Peltaster fructicola TaxID=286661 RepID=A0A6H0XW45_9PEZI|nr:hypothetical protein AMS68_004504 [Peltaster fructicola]